MGDISQRRLLAVYLTFDPPSYRSCMMVIRECVRRFGRMPQIAVVDGGIEYSGVYFETLLVAISSPRSISSLPDQLLCTAVSSLSIFYLTTARHMYHLSISGALAWPRPHLTLWVGG